jgi:hypothetical protein
MERTLDPAMAIDKHTNRVVKSTIRLHTYLYRHPLLSSALGIDDWQLHYCNIGAQLHPKLTYAPCNT